MTDFQMMYAGPAWKAERASWRSVVQLNLVRSINLILDILAKHLSKRSPHPSTHGLSSAYLPSPVSPSDHALSPLRKSTLQLAATSSEASDDDQLNFTDTHRALRLKLAPLRHIEADLCGLLGIPVSEPTDTSSPLTPQSPGDALPTSSSSPSKKEAAVRSWKNALVGGGSGTVRLRNPRGARQHIVSREDEADAASDMLAMCRDDIAALWNDEVIQKMLDRANIHLQHLPGL
jgi:hypothetical protein